MTEGEALQLAGVTSLLWRGQDISRETAQLWWSAGLCDVELRHAVEGVKAIAKYQPFVPQLSELIEAAHQAARRERENRPQVVEGPGVPPPPELTAAVHAALRKRADKRPLARVLAKLAREVLPDEASA